MYRIKRVVLCGAVVAAGNLFAMSVPVSQLPAQCTLASGACTTSSNVTSGVCRTIKFTTAAGLVQVQVCDKSDHYELYRQAAPSGLTFKGCTGSGCVDQMTGFASFTGTTLPGGSSPPPPPPPPPTSSPTPLVDPASAGFANETREANLDRLTNAWWLNGMVVQTFPLRLRHLRLGPVVQHEQQLQRPGPQTRYRLSALHGR